MSYVRCAYAPILDEVLGKPLKTGQGGHWEATPADAYLALALLAASLSSFLAREIKLDFGEQSKELIQTAAWTYGRYRGEAIRRRVEKLGLPLDIPHMRTWWDLPKLTEHDDIRLNSDLTSYYHGYEILNCPFNDVYQVCYPADLRGLHCEAMHLGAYKGFNPAIETWLPALLPRGQAKCLSRLRIPPDEAEKIAARATSAEEPVREIDDAATSYRLSARQVVIIYHFFTGTLLSAVGLEQTESLLRRAMANWGTWRGQEMREAHLAKGWPLDLETFITYHDDPAADNAWQAENVRLTPTEHHIEFTQSAWSELFDELGTGKLAAVFFEEPLPAQARAYDSRITVTIPRLMERGDSVTELHYVVTA